MNTSITTEGNPSARNLCLTLATLCELTHSWEGAQKLRRAAEYLYRVDRIGDYNAELRRKQRLAGW